MISFRKAMFSLLICRYNVCKDGIVFQRIEFATQETTSSNNGKTIGLTTAGNTKVSSRDLFREAVQKNGLGGTSEADAESQTENGIVSNKCQNGKMIDSWELKDTNPNDTKKVQDLLNRFEKDANLIFSGSKDFWEEFLNNG